jgi:hypothetical protein
MILTIFERPNASLIFKRLVTTPSDNPYLENREECDDFIVLLSIEEGSISELKTEGQRKDLIKCNGRLAHPTILPTEFRSQRQAKITIYQEGDNSFPLEGVAYIKPQLNSRLGLESFFGEYIQLDVKLS